MRQFSAAQIANTALVLLVLATLPPEAGSTSSPSDTTSASPATSTTITLPASMQRFVPPPATVPLALNGTCTTIFTLLGSNSLVNVRFIAVYDDRVGTFTGPSADVDCSVLTKFDSLDVYDKSGILHVQLAVTPDKAFYGPLDLLQCEFGYVGWKPNPDDFIIQVKSAESAYSTADKIGRPDVIISSLTCIDN